MKRMISMFDTSPFVSIWLERKGLGKYWHNKISQGPKKKCIHFSRGGSTPVPPGHTARNKGSFAPYALWSVESFFPQL